jgi:cytochrome c oxidase assembly factor CtaG
MPKHIVLTLKNLVFVNYGLIFWVEIAVISTEKQVILHPSKKRYTVKGYPFYFFLSPFYSVLPAILDYCPQEQLFFPYLF